MKRFFNLALICLLFLCFHVTELYSQTPTTTNLVLRLRADYGITSGSGSKVAGWSDFNSNGLYAVQIDEAFYPTLVSNSMNNKPAIKFNSAAHEFLELYTPNELGIQSHEYEMFFIAKSSIVGVQFLIGGAFEKYELHLDGSAGIRFIPNNGPYIDKGSQGNYSDGNAHIFSIRASSSGGTVRVDGLDGATLSGSKISADDNLLKIGCRTNTMLNNESWFNGEIAEVLIYNRVLESYERDDIEAYAKAWYGINSGALPVEMNSFSAAVKDFKAVLNWETATEVSNYGFEIERAAVSGKQNEAPEYVKAGFVNGSGNSNSKKSYTFTDQAVTAGSYLYRIRQVDNNGTCKYYGPVSVNIDSPGELVLFQNSPNPFNPVTAISYNLPKQANVTLKIYDQLGRLVNTLTDEVKQAGSHVTYWNGRDSHGNIVSSGVYLYRLTAGEFSQSRKMNFAK